MNFTLLSLMAEKLIILHGKNILRQDSRFAALANFCGIAPEYTPLKALRSTNLKQAFLAVDAATFGHAVETGFLDSAMRRRIVKQASCLFVYKLNPTNQSHTALRWITDDIGASIQGVHNASVYTINDKNKHITAELSDISWGAATARFDSSIQLTRKSADYDPIVTLGNGAFFLEGTIGRCNVFLLANGSFLEIENTVNDDTRLKTVCSQFAPALMVLRFAFGAKCWHSIQQFANFIIDDPYLQPRYGFIRMRRLIEQAGKHDFAVTIAFIPYNYKRTHQDIARSIQENHERIGICMHGCNHTHHEFGTSNTERLSGLIQDARFRMESHAMKTRIKHQEIMVFPQGVFSSSAMQALKEHNFLASVNSTPLAVDVSPIPLRYLDLLRIAVTKYNDMPLLIRRYPYEDLLEYRLDAFIGRPLLFVEHHEFLKDDHARLIRFIRQVKKFPFPIVWSNLSTILNNCYQVRLIKPSFHECAVYSNAIILANPLEEPMRYRVTKPEHNPTSLASVLYDDVPMDYGFSHDQIISEITIAPYSQSRITYTYKKPPRSNFHYSLQESCEIRIRRVLCNVRDNYFSKIPKLLSIAQRIRNVFPNS